MPSRVIALVPAAGSGARMGLALPKQYLPLGARCVLERSIDALLACPRIAAVSVVVAADDRQAAALARQAGAAWARVDVLACGGASRAETVRNGLLALAPVTHADDWVLVHDGARPCVTAGEIERLLDAVLSAGADTAGGLLGLPLADTLKQADAGRVARTVERGALWRAATPQLFRHGLLLDALAGAPDLATLTDESAAIERLGGRPLLVEGEATNLKITRPADLALAAAILKEQGRW